MSLKHSRASRARWAKVPKEERSKRMAALVALKHKKTSESDKRAHALLMVKGRRKNAKPKFL